MMADGVMTRRVTLGGLMRLVRKAAPRTRANYVRRPNGKDEAFAFDVRHALEHLESAVVAIRKPFNRYDHDGRPPSEAELREMRREATKLLGNAAWVASLLKLKELELEFLLPGVYKPR